MWFMLLLQDQRDTFDRLQEAFLRRYDNPHNNYSDADTFYSRRQQLGEPVATYIDDMMNLGAKLHINVNDMVATIKRGLLDPIKMHVMTRGVEQPHELIQQATLAENYYIKSPQMLATQRAQVRFDIGLDDTNTAHATNTANLHQAASEIKSMIGSLSQQVERINFDSQRLGSRSMTPHYYMIHQPHRYRGNNAADTQARYTINSTNDIPYCTYCNSQGHMYNYCKLRQQNRQQQNSSYTPPFQQPRGRTMQRQTYASRQYAQSQPSGYNTNNHSRFEQYRQANQYQQNYQRYGGNSSQGRRNHF